MTKKLEPKTPKQTKPLRTFSGIITVGIYKNQRWTVKVYADRTITKIPYVKWEGQTGTLEVEREVIPLRTARHQRLVKLVNHVGILYDTAGFRIDKGDRALQIAQGKILLP